jgi:hypothetical protein
MTGKPEVLVSGISTDKRACIEWSGQLLDCRQTGSNAANISKDPGCCGRRDRQECHPGLFPFADPGVAVAPGD